MEHLYDMIIIGGGPGGYSAALYAARAGFDTLVIERLSPGGQMALTGDIDNYPGYDEGIDGFTLGMKMQSGAEKYGAKTEYAEVTGLDIKEKTKKVITLSGVYYCRTLVIASGANPRELGLENEIKFTGHGVHYCAHCDGRFYKDKTVAVIGGGNSAAADALYLSHLAKKVYLVHRRDTLRAAKLYHSPLEKADNVEFVWNSTVHSLTGNEKITGFTVLSTKSDELKHIDCDGIFISIGRKPATAFVKGTLDLDENGYIIADETTRTHTPGVFAIGDVRTKALRQVVTAAADGATCVHFAEEYLAEY